MRQLPVKLTGDERLTFFLRHHPNCRPYSSSLRMLCPDFNSAILIMMLWSNFTRSIFSMLILFSEWSNFEVTIFNPNIISTVGVILVLVVIRVRDMMNIPVVQIGKILKVWWTGFASIAFKTLWIRCLEWLCWPFCCSWFSWWSKWRIRSNWWISWCRSCCRSCRCSCCCSCCGWCFGWLSFTFVFFPFVLVDGFSWGQILPFTFTSFAAFAKKSGINFSFIQAKVMVTVSAFDRANFLFFAIDLACRRLLDGIFQGCDFATSNTFPLKSVIFMSHSLSFNCC